MPLEHLTKQLKRDPNVRGVLLTGSRARGDALPGSDIDFLVLVASLPEQTFVGETVDGLLVERHIRDAESARARLSQNPMERYSYLDGNILYDPDGLLAELKRVAREGFDGYRVAARDKRAIRYWLQSVGVKLRAAVGAGDTLKMGYHTSTNSWKVLEGLWAINDKPMPPAGAVWAHLPDLERRPEGLERSLHTLFTGDTAARARVMLGLIDWLLERSTEPD